MSIEIPEFARSVRLLTRDETVAFMQVSKNYLWKISDPKKRTDYLPSYKMGKRRNYRFDEIMWWLEKHRV